MEAASDREPRNVRMPGKAVLLASRAAAFSR